MGDLRFEHLSWLHVFIPLFTHPFRPFGGQFQRDLEFHHAVGSISTPKHMGPRWVRVVWVNLKIGVLSTSRHRWLRIGIRVPMDPQISTKQAIHGEVDGFDLFDPQK